jgi:O-antigen/teichoic acid export membrane protein
VCPALVVMGLAAPELLRGVLGSEWSGAANALRILCAGGLFRAVYNLNDAVARATGAVYAQFRRHLIYALAVVGFAIAGSPWGIEGVAAGVLLSLFLMYLLTTQLALALLGCGWAAALRAQVPGLATGACAAIGALPVLAFCRSLNLPSLTTLGAAAVCGAAAAGIPIVLFRRSWLGPLLRIRLWPPGASRAAAALQARDTVDGRGSPWPSAMGPQEGSD